MPFIDIEKRRAYQRAYMKKWRERNPEKARVDYASFKERMKSYTPEQRKRKQHRQRIRNKVRAFLILGGRCTRCGETDFRLLTLNHKNGDGWKDRVYSPNGKYRYSYQERMYNQIRRFERDDLELLCWNCQALFEWDRSGKWFPEELKVRLKKELKEHKMEQDWFGEVPD